MQEPTVRRWGGLVATIAAIAGLPGGCGGGASSAPDGGSTLASACTNYATGVCQALQKCEPGVLQYFYPDGLPSCISTSKLSCEASIEAPFSGATTTLFEQCGSGIQAMTCAQYYSFSNDPSCYPHGGTIANGGSCGDNWQCASGRCSVTDPSPACGVCVAQVVLGAPCTNIECADGLACSPSARGSTSFVCSKPVGLGEPCFDSSVCPGNASCGATSGTCDPLPGSGQACDTMDTFCDVSQTLLLCDPYLAECAPPASSVAAGQACGYVTATSPRVACEGICAANPGSNAGTCFATLAQGAACTSADFCDYNLQCVGGVCVPIGPTACNGTPIDAGSGPVDAGSDAATDAGLAPIDAGLARLDAASD